MEMGDVTASRTNACQRGVSVMFEQIGPDPQSDCLCSRKKTCANGTTASYAQNAKVKSGARCDEAQVAASDWFKYYILIDNLHKFHSKWQRLVLSELTLSPMQRFSGRNDIENYWMIWNCQKKFFFVCFINKNVGLVFFQWGMREKDALFVSPRKPEICVYCKRCVKCTYSISTHNKSVSLYDNFTQITSNT